MSFALALSTMEARPKPRNRLDLSVKLPRPHLSAQSPKPLAFNPLHLACPPRPNPPHVVAQEASMSRTTMVPLSAVALNLSTALIRLLPIPGRRLRSMGLSAQVETRPRHSVERRMSSLVSALALGIYFTRDPITLSGYADTPLTRFKQ